MNCPEWEEILNCLRSEYRNEEKGELILKLKDCDSQNESIKGLQKFLKENNYDIDKTSLFINETNKSIDQKIGEFSLQKTKQPKKKVIFIPKALKLLAVILILTSLAIWYFN